MSFCGILYEKIPTFCYHCGLVSHGTNTCNRQSSGSQENPYAPLCPDPSDQQKHEVGDDSIFMSDDMDAGMVPKPPDIISNEEQLIETTNTEFGPWMLFSRRKGHGGERGGARGSRRPESGTAHAQPHDHA